MRFDWLRKIAGYSLAVVAMVFWLALCAVMMLINACLGTKLGTRTSGGAAREQRTGNRQ